MALTIQFQDVRDRIREILEERICRPAYPGKKTETEEDMWSRQQGVPEFEVFWYVNLPRPSCKVSAVGMRQLRGLMSGE